MMKTGRRRHIVLCIERESWSFRCSRIVVLLFVRRIVARTGVMRFRSEEMGEGARASRLSARGSGVRARCIFLAKSTIQLRAVRRFLVVVGVVCEIVVRGVRVRRGAVVARME